MHRIERPATAKATTDDVLGRSNQSAHIGCYDDSDEPNIDDLSYVKVMANNAVMKPLGLC